MLETYPNSLSASSKPMQSPNLSRRESSAYASKRKRNDGEDDDFKTLLKYEGQRYASKRSLASQSNLDISVDLDQRLNLEIARMDGQLLADHIAKQTKFFSPSLSLIELEERYISGMFVQNSFG